MKSFVFNMHGKCNATCRHCCFKCSPLNQDKFSKEELEEILDYLKENEVKQFAITGGEPFLLEEFLFELICKVSEMGIDVTCITNGFWATSYEIAKCKLVELQKMGLKALTVSYDDFHREFIPIDRIQNLFEAAKSIDIHYALNMCVTKNFSGDKIIQELGKSVFGIEITKVPVVPVGNAKNIDESDLYFEITDLKKLSCPEKKYEFVLHHDKYVYSCCSPVIFHTILRVGPLGKYSIVELEKKIFSNIILYIIRKEGLDWFIKRLPKDFFIPKHFVSSCHVCEYLFRDDTVINLLKDDIMRYHDEEFS